MHFLLQHLNHTKRCNFQVLGVVNDVVPVGMLHVIYLHCVVSVKPAGWIYENDKNNVLRPTFLTTGCALAGLDILESAAQTKSLPFITNAFESLQQELSNCRTAIREAQQYSGMGMAERLQLRGWAIDLTARIAHAAVTVSSGAANYSNHAAQRVYREVLVFTVTGQTSAVMEATLERLRRPNFENEPQLHPERREERGKKEEITYSRASE